MQKEQFRHRHRLWDRLGISASRSVSGALCGVAFFAGRDARTGTL